MAKIKPAKKNAAKPTAADWSKAVPCLFFLVAGFLIGVLLLYFAMTGSYK